MTKWVRRSEEWIRANPGKGTLYKIDADDKPIQKPAKMNFVKKMKAQPHSGVYVIICEKEKAVYVGQSINIGNRLRSHKMTIISAKNDGDVPHIKMKEHCKKHKIQSFIFARYRDLPGAKRNELLEAEAEVMLEFIKLGYYLYNIALPIGTIKKFQPHVKDVLNAMMSGLITSDDIRTLIQSKSELTA